MSSESIELYYARCELLYRTEFAILYVKEIELPQIKDELALKCAQGLLIMYEEAVVRHERAIKREIRRMFW